MADLTLTVANVLAGTNAQITRTGIAGATIAQGDVLYRDTADSNKLKLADANAASPANSVAGIALTAGSNGQPVIYVTEDDDFTVGSTLTSGMVYVLSATAGKICQSVDLASGHTSIVLGVAKSSTKLAFKIVAGGTV